MAALVTSQYQVVKDKWEQACAWDGVKPNAKFVVISQENPFVEAYESALIDYTLELFPGSVALT